MITFTKEQLSEVMCKHAEKENGLHDLLEIMLESLMVAERSEFLHEQQCSFFCFFLASFFSLLVFGSENIYLCIRSRNSIWQRTTSKGMYGY